jgi:hypothetical protein
VWTFRQNTAIEAVGQSCCVFVQAAGKIYFDVCFQIVSPYLDLYVQTVYKCHAIYSVYQGQVLSVCTVYKENRTG